MSDTLSTDVLRAVGELSHSDVVVREGAAWKIGHLGRLVATERPFDPRPLIHALDDPEPRVRRAAAWALGRLGDRRATTVLVRLLQHDEAHSVRWVAAQALGEIGSAADGVFEALAQSVEHDQAPGVRRAAVTALGALGSHRAVSTLIEALGQPDPAVAQAAAIALRRLDVGRDDPTLAAIIAAVTTAPWTVHAAAS